MAESPHTLPMVSSELSSLVPLPAGVWGVRVQPGPGFGDVYHRFATCMGTVLHPATAVADWCRTVGESDVGPWCDDCEFHQLGGWYVGRSAAVMWDGDDRVFYYRAGDEGCYDLAWIVPDDYAFDPILYLRAENTYYEYMRAIYPKALQVARCESRRRCRMLQQMLDGSDVRDVTGWQ